MFAAGFLGERAGFRRWAVIGLGFAGVLVILRPHAVPVEWAALICILGAAGYAGANVLSKELMRTDTPIQIVLWMLVIQLPIAALANWGQWTPVVWEDAGWIAIVGLTGVVAHLTMNQSIRLGDISVVVPVTYIQLPLLGLVGIRLLSGSPGDNGAARRRHGRRRRLVEPRRRNPDRKRTVGKRAGLPPRLHHHDAGRDDGKAREFRPCEAFAEQQR